LKVFPLRKLKARSEMLAVTAVAFFLAELLGEDGRLDPSQQYIATRVGCSRKTAGDAVKALEAAGLLRHVCRRHPDGGQWSNAYELLFPDSEAALPPGEQAVMPAVKLSTDRGIISEISTPQTDQVRTISKKDSYKTPSCKQTEKLPRYRKYRPLVSEVRVFPTGCIAIGMDLALDKSARRVAVAQSQRRRRPWT
jgi:hypothetical protein